MTVLSILIVNWNTREMLANCLRSVIGNQAELIVVDNGSSDGSGELVKTQFPQVKLIENEENVGFARANNQAIAKATGKYLLLLNSDTEVHLGALDTLVDFMENHPQAGAAGARLLNGDGSLQPACHPMLTPEREFWRLLFLDKFIKRSVYPVDQWNTTTPRRIEVIKGACLLVRQNVLNAVGWLDDSYFMYTEEVDLCYRIAQAGWELWYVPQAAITHYGEASSRQMAEEMYIQLYRSKVQFYRKFGGDQRANQFKHYLHLVYWPRVVTMKIASRFDSVHANRARIYRQLLAELPGM